MKLIAAVIQMVSTAHLAENLRSAEMLIAGAAKKRAQWVLLPENFALMGLHETDKLKIMESEDGPIQIWLSEQAQRWQIWIVGGSIPLQAPDGRCYATSLVYSPEGKKMARYDKIYLFDVSLPQGEKYKESHTIAPGKIPVTTALPWGTLGLSICYDVRFPELYRNYAGAHFITVPSAFTQQTGRAHWEILLRARAIENQAFVLAANQGGTHQNGRTTFGHSMIIDPWGTVLAQVHQGEGFAIAELVLEHLEQARRSIPCLSHR